MFSQTSRVSNVLYFFDITSLRILSPTLIKVMVIPFALLWKVQIPQRKKIAFIGLFSLSLITIAIAIARTADLGATVLTGGQLDSTYLWLWSAIQSSLGKHATELVFIQ